MPAKSKSNKRAAQALTPAQKEKLALQKAWRAYQEKQRKAQAKERDKILVATLKAARGKGIYDPKSLKLTKYRRTKARQVQREYGEFLDPSKYFYVAPKKEKTKTFVDRANALSMKVTGKGLFIAKDGHKRVTVKYNKKHDELFIERSGKSRTGNAGKVKYRTITPLASLDALDNERNRLRNLAAKLGPVKKGEVLIFHVHENGVDGYSRHTYSRIDDILAALDTYQKNAPAKIQFFRHVTVEKRSMDEYTEFYDKTWLPGLKEREKERMREYGKNYRASRVKKLADKKK